MRERVIVAGIGAAAILIFFWPVFDSPQHIPFAFLDFTYESGAVYQTRELIREGGWPFWSQAEWCGLPWIHAMMGVYYPLNWPFYAGAPWPDFFMISYAMHLVLMMLGVYLFLRDLGIDRIVACAAGLAMAFGRVTVMRIVSGQASFLETLTWIPWFFWAVERGMGRRSLAYFALAGLFNALPVLTLQPDAAIFMGNALLPCLLFRVWIARERRDAFKFAVKGGLVYLVAAVLISMPQVIPMFSLMKDSMRELGGASIDHKASALHPLYLFLYLFPNFFGSPLDSTYWGLISSIWGPYPYVGVPVVLSALWVIVHPPADHSQSVRWFTGFSIVFLVLSMGGYTPVFPVLSDILPLFSSFRLTYKILPFAEFGLCVLAAIGWQEMIRRRQSGQALLGNAARRVTWIAGITCAVTPIILWLFRESIFRAIEPMARDIIDHLYHVQQRGHVRPIEHYYAQISSVYPAILFAVIQGCATIAASLAFFRWMGRLPSTGAAAMCLAALLFADLWLANGKFILPGRIEHYFPDSPIYRHIRDTIGIDRINGHPGAWAIETSMVNEFQDVNGGIIFQSKEYVDYLKAIDGDSLTIDAGTGTVEGLVHINHPLYHLMGVRYLLTERPVASPGHRLVAVDTGPIFRKENYMDLIFDKSGLVYLYENQNRHPRLFFATEAVVVPSEDVLETMTRLGDRLRQVVVLDQSPTRPTDGYPGDSFQSAASRSVWPERHHVLNLVSYRSSRIEIDVESDSGGLVVLTDRFRAGWRADVDGAPRPVLKADHLFRAVEVEPGRHRIVFRYNPPEVRTAALLGFAGVAWILGWLIFGRPRIDFDRRMK